MTPFFLVLPLAACAAAQLTTSIWMPTNIYGTDKLGFYGSVIAADESHTTVLLSFDNGTQTRALELGAGADTFVIAPTMWEVALTYWAVHKTVTSATPSDAYMYRLGCQKQTTENAKPTCTRSWGRSVASEDNCDAPAATPGPESTYIQTHTHSFSGRGSYSAGVETVTKAITMKPQTTPPPDWCNAETLPSDFSGYVETLADSSIDAGFFTYQVFMTAGLEKLSATTGGSASTGAPTASTASTAAAAPLQTAGSVVGYGAAMALLFL
jgi:hypothetical protein